MPIPSQGVLRWAGLRSRSTDAPGWKRIWQLGVLAAFPSDAGDIFFAVVDARIDCEPQFLITESTRIRSMYSRQGWIGSRSSSSDSW